MSEDRIRIIRLEAQTKDAHVSGSDTFEYIDTRAQFRTTIAQLARNVEAQLDDRGLFDDDPDDQTNTVDRITHIIDAYIEAHITERISNRGVAEAIATELGIQPDEWTPGRWWRVIRNDGGPLWCETSDEYEARQALERCPSGGRLQRQYFMNQDQWRDEP